MECTESQSTNGSLFYQFCCVNGKVTPEGDADRFSDLYSSG